jgi:hypothetical protein
MLKKLIGGLGFILGCIGFMIFIYSLFVSGPRVFILISLEVCLLSMIFAVIGHFIHRQRLLFNLSMVLSLIPYLFAIVIYLFFST